MIALVSSFMAISTISPHGVSLHKTMAAILAMPIVKAWLLTPGFAHSDVDDLIPAVAPTCDSMPGRLVEATALHRSAAFRHPSADSTALSFILQSCAVASSSRTL